jgi:hypothetical protein
MTPPSVTQNHIGNCRMADAVTAIVAAGASFGCSGAFSLHSASDRQ